MTTGQKTQGKGRTIPGSILLATGSELTLTLILCGVLAKLVDAEVLPEKTIPYSVWGILLISSFAGARISCRKAGHHNLLCCLLHGFAFLACLFSVNALFFEGQYDGVGGTALVVLLGCLLGILSFRKNGQRKKRRKKR